MLKKDEKKLFDEIEKPARPIDLGTTLLLKEILVVLKNILKELRDRD